LAEQVQNKEFPMPLVSVGHYRKGKPFSHTKGGQVIGGGNANAFVHWDVMGKECLIFGVNFFR
jgi:hypothetical protein